MFARLPVSSMVLRGIGCLREAKLAWVCAFVCASTVGLAAPKETRLPASPPPLNVSSQDIRASVLEIWLAHQHVDKALPGLSVAVTKRGTSVFQAAMGQGSRSGAATMMTPTTPLFAGSVTKVITAAMVLRLVERGELSLDTAISAVLPKFRPHDAQPITVRHLLRHSSGLPREVPGHPYWVTYKFPDAEALVTAMNHAPLAFKPGAQTQYSNAAFGLLGLVIEAVTKTSLETAVQQTFLNPLGLKATTVRPTAGQRRQAAPSFTQRKRFLGGRRTERPVADPKAMAGAFGALTTPSDLARFGCFLASNDRLDVLSKKSRDLLFYGPLNEHGVGRGLGMKREKVGDTIFLSHTGWFSGFRTHLAIAPKEELCVVVQATSDDAAVRPLAFALLSSLLEGPAPKTEPGVAPGGQGLTDLVGTYGVQWLPDFDLVVDRGRLHLYLPSSDLEESVFSGLHPVALATTKGVSVLHVLGGKWKGAHLTVHRDATGNVEKLVNAGGLLIFKRRPAMARPPARGGRGGSGGG